LRNVAKGLERAVVGWSNQHDAAHQLGAAPVQDRKASIRLERLRAVAKVVAGDQGTHRMRDDVDAGGVALEPEFELFAVSGPDGDVQRLCALGKVPAPVECHAVDSGCRIGFGRPRGAPQFALRGRVARRARFAQAAQDAPEEAGVGVDGEPLPGNLDLAVLHDPVGYDLVTHLGQRLAARHRQRDAALHIGPPDALLASQEEPPHLMAALPIDEIAAQKARDDHHRLERCLRLAVPVLVGDPANPVSCASEKDDQHAEHCEADADD